MSDTAPTSCDWQGLKVQLERASGPDGGVDAALAAALPGNWSAITASAETARQWAVTALPGWHLHIGFDVAGVLPYAACSQGDRHVEATAPTVPLAILRAAVSALAAA